MGVRKMLAWHGRITRLEDALAGFGERGRVRHGFSATEPALLSFRLRVVESHGVHNSVQVPLLNRAQWQSLFSAHLARHASEFATLQAARAVYVKKSSHICWSQSCVSIRKSSSVLSLPNLDPHRVGAPRNAPRKADTEHAIHWLLPSHGHEHACITLLTAPVGALYEFTPAYPLWQRAHSATTRRYFRSLPELGPTNFRLGSPCTPTGESTPTLDACELRACDWCRFVLRDVSAERYSCAQEAMGQHPKATPANSCSRIQHVDRMILLHNLRTATVDQKNLFPPAMGTRQCCMNPHQSLQRCEVIYHGNS